MANGSTSKLEALGLVAGDFPLVYRGLRRYVIKECSACPQCGAPLGKDKVCSGCDFDAGEELTKA